MGEGILYIGKGNQDDLIDGGFRFNDQLSWIKGKHSIAFGGDIRTQLFSPFDAAFVAYTMAAVVTLLGAVPLGLGSFEATSIAVLRLMGVPFEAGLSATLLYRGFALWLPLGAGLFLTRGLAKK